MAVVRISEPVSETRELLERLIRRMGHDVAAPGQPADATLHSAAEPGDGAPLTHPFSPGDVRRALEDALDAPA